MEFKYTPELTEYILKHHKKTLLVEMVEVSSSDLEITELHAYFINARMREQFVIKNEIVFFPRNWVRCCFPGSLLKWKIP